jgi:hypothetical protein
MDFRVRPSYALRNMAEPVTATGLFLGAAISFIPALILGWVQAFYQRKSEKGKFVIEKRYDALKECAVAISDVGEVHDAFEELRVRLSLAPSAQSFEEFAKTSRAASHLVKVQVGYKLKVRTHGVLIASLFNQPFPTAPPLRVVELPSVAENLSEQERREIVLKYLEALRPVILDWYQSFVKLTDDYEVYLKELGSKLTEV